MRGGTVASNTVYECAHCHSIFDFDGALEKTQEPCPNCNHRPFQWQQKPVVIVCDFCSTPVQEEDLWTFFCPDFEYDYMVVGMVSEGSKGNWAACEECKDLILANDQRGLTTRSMDMEELRDPGMKPHRQVLYAMGAAIHRGFFKNKLDKPPVKGAGPDE